MIKVKLLPMQFYYCIKIKNMYYIGDNAKYLGATIDVELPCLPSPGSPILLTNLDLDKIYNEWVAVLEGDWPYCDNPVESLVEQVKHLFHYDTPLSDKDVLHDIIFCDYSDDMFSCKYCASETMKPIFIQGEDYVVLPVDNVKFHIQEKKQEERHKQVNTVKKEKVTRIFKVIEVEEA